MMGKQYNRMKQLGKQKILRAEKTEVLNDDLQQCEKKVDIIKDSCMKTVKELKKCLQGAGQDVEKRTRKLPHTMLGQSMMDSSQALGETSVFGLTLGKSAEVWTNIGQELTSHEMGLENLVITPFSLLLDNEIPSIMSMKRKLNRLTLDLDSVKGRYQTASSKGIDKEHLAKLDAIKEEMEQCQWKVDACKESLATEMMSLVAKDGMLARCLVDMVKSQAQYHRNVLARLEKLIPQLNDDLTEAPTQGVFGLALEDHLRLQGREIASPLETCIFWIMELGLDEEGLFRIAGSASRMKMIRAALDANVEIDVDLGMEHALAGVLKQYLRELPEPLLTFSLYQDFIGTLVLKDKDQKLQALWTIVNNLPKSNYANFKYLIKFLSKVAGRSDQNKMNASNLSLVVGPNCLWSEEDGGMSVTSTGVCATIIESFISYADWFFPDEINFSITRPKCNSFSETTQGVDGTDSAAPTVTSSPASHGDTHHSPAVAVSSAHSTPVAHHHPGLTATSPQLDTSISPLQQSLLSDKMRSASLPKRSVKKNPAPPVPAMSPTPSPNSSLSRNTPIPSPSNLNGTTPSNVAEKNTPEKPAKVEKPTRFSKGEKPPVLEKPARPPLPAKKTSQTRESSSPPPPPVTPVENVPPSPTLRPKSTNLSRPTISPPPPPPTQKSPKPSLNLDSNDTTDENTQL
ncbi:rho GTPase-activating protein 17-like isoform X1 [Asterias rubens]|uniref:rho GTPase-activating protein 17-like isoform X1 n=1 Tax=Asterias rubens TaxID=7604 RepID=UPI00145528F3|nr:rho GTPase-activating protein 17-like isoform X1 [Asterias rubens]XP_033631104.1 rho GTPase-activating protein 17-like isoform X1 [Asterias rubens]